MRTKLLALCITLCLVLSAFGVTVVAAQVTTNSKAPGSWTTSINVQNVGSGSADVVLNFYNGNGQFVTSVAADTAIPAGGQRTFYSATEFPGLASGQYSLVVSSNQPVLAVANSVS